MTVSTPKTDKWTRQNHHFYGKERDGYAVCDNCGAHENEDGIIRPCPNGPAVMATVRKAGADAQLWRNLEALMADEIARCVCDTLCPTDSDGHSDLCKEVRAAPKGRGVAGIRETAEQSLSWLKTLEWAGGYDLIHDSDPLCPMCHGRKSEGHYFGCQLATELARG